MAWSHGFGYYIGDPRHHIMTEINEETVDDNSDDDERRSSPEVSPSRINDQMRREQQYHLGEEQPRTTTSDHIDESRELVLQTESEPNDDHNVRVAELSNLIGQLDGIAYYDFIDYAQTITMNNAPGPGSSSSDSSAYSNKFDLALDQLDMDTVKMLISKAKELPKAIQPPQDEDSPIPRKKAKVSNTHLETLLKVSNEKRQ